MGSLNYQKYRDQRYIIEIIPNLRERCGECHTPNCKAKYNAPMISIYLVQMSHQYPCTCQLSVCCLTSQESLSLRAGSDQEEMGGGITPPGAGPGITGGAPDLTRNSVKNFIDCPS